MSVFVALWYVFEDEGHVTRDSDCLSFRRERAGAAWLGGTGCEDGRSATERQSIAGLCEASPSLVNTPLHHLSAPGHPQCCLEQFAPPPGLASRPSGTSAPSSSLARCSKHTFPTPDASDTQLETSTIANMTCHPQTHRLRHLLRCQLCHSPRN